MANNAEVAPISAEDWQRHNPAAGPGTQTFTRRKRTNPAATEAVIAVAADWIPVLDAPILTGANTPFEAIADTLATKHTENCLKDVRKHQAGFKNFRTCGGIPGNAVSVASAAKNTELFQFLLTEMNADDVNGIVFDTTFLFSENAGAMPTINGFPNVVLLGVAGGGMKRHGSASDAMNLLTVIDCPGAKFVEMTFDRNGTTGAGNGIAFSASAEQDIGGVYFLNNLFIGGNKSLSAGVTVATFFMSTYWVIGNRFAGAATANCEILGGSGGHILNNDFSTSGDGLSLVCGGGALLLSNVEILGNTFGANSQGISVVRSGVYNANNHKGLILRGNRLSGTSASINIQGVNRVEVSSSEILSGALNITFDMLTAETLKLLDNNISNPSGVGMAVIGNVCTLTGYQIRGGTIRNCLNQGLSLLFSGAPIRGGTIAGISIIDCSRYNGGLTQYSGILLGAPDAAGGVQDTIVENNIIRCYSATGLGNKHLYGVEEQAGGVSNRNMIGPNFIKGFMTADVLVTGALSLDVVGTVAATIANYIRFDGGIPV